MTRPDPSIQPLSEQVSPERFLVDLGGIVDLLSTAIYSTRTVFLRELIQNATDAITRRTELQPGWSTAGIVITPAGHHDLNFSISDDGIGLTPAEITEFLATVGASSKRDDFGLPTSAIGRFGIGLLSALMVTDTITVRTRSAMGGPSLEWVGRADGTYDVAHLEEELAAGTTVSFTARPSDREFVSAVAAEELARRYAQYLQIPIQVRAASGPRQITEPAPFLSDDPGTIMEFGAELLGTTPFAAIPLDIPLTGTRGVAYVLPFPAPPNSTGAHRVFCGRMLISDQHREIAPSWAFFTRIVVNSTGLNPTASRESLVADDVLLATKDAIGEAIRGWIVALHHENPAGLAEFVATHYLGLKALALHDEDLGPLIVRHLPMETSRGLRPIGELLEFSTELSYVLSTDQFRQVQALSSTRATIINATYTWDRDLLEKLPQLIPGVIVRHISIQDVLDRLDDVPVNDRAAAAAFESRASRALVAHDAEASVRVATSPDVPSYLLTDPDLMRRIERGNARGAAKGRWAKVIAKLDQMSPSDSTPGSRVLYNWSNPTVRRIARLEDPLRFERSVNLLHLQAVLATGRPLTARESADLTTTVTDLIDLWD